MSYIPPKFNETITLSYSAHTPPTDLATIQLAYGFLAPENPDYKQVIPNRKAATWQEGIFYRNSQAVVDPWVEQLAYVCINPDTEAPTTGSTVLTLEVVE